MLIDMLRRENIDMIRERGDKLDALVAEAEGLEQEPIRVKQFKLSAKSTEEKHVLEERCCCYLWSSLWLVLLAIVLGVLLAARRMG